MSGVNIKFNPKSNTIKISDEAKTKHYFFSVFCVLQLLRSGLQIYTRWGELDSTLFYIFLFLFIAFAGFLIFYFFYNSIEKEVHIDDISYYKEKQFLWSKLRYFKLKSNKYRLLEFRPKSKAPNSLLNYLDKYQVSIKS